MKIVHFNTFDSGGGAANAAYQLHKSLREGGLETLMIVKKKTRVDDSIIEIRSPIPSLRNIITIIYHSSLFGPVCKKLYSFYKNRKNRKWRNLSTVFNRNTNSISLNSIKKYLIGVNVICLHWIDGFLSTKMIKSIQQFTNAPIVWTLQDIEPLTGGCHYPYDCEGFKKSCGNCPQLKSGKENDMSRVIWNQKNSDLKDRDITFVAPSSWTYNRIKESSLFNQNPVKKIPLSVDTDIFKRLDKKFVRGVLNLPKDKKIIFFGAQSLKDKRKGMEYLAKALNILYKKLNTENKKLLDSIMLVSAGNGVLDIENRFEHKHLGWINEERILALVYQAADIFACPSIEDGGPVMINQAVMCGTPVVAFNTGIAPDLITSEERGYLAEKYDTEDFCLGLYHFLSKKKGIDENVWRQPEECKPCFQIKKYCLLFETILNKQKI